MFNNLTKKDIEEKYEELYEEYKREMKDVENYKKINNKCKFFRVATFEEFINIKLNKQIYTYEEALMKEIERKNRTTFFCDLSTHKINKTEDEILYIIIENIFEKENIDINDDEQIAAKYVEVERKYGVNTIRGVLYPDYKDLLYEFFLIRKEEPKINKKYLNKRLKCEELEYNAMKYKKNIKEMTSQKLKTYRRDAGLQELFINKLKYKEEYLKVDLLIYKYVIELVYLFKIKDFVKTKKRKKELENKFNKLAHRIETIKRMLNNDFLNTYFDYDKEIIEFAKEKKKELKEERDEIKKFLMEHLKISYKEFAKLKHEQVEKIKKKNLHINTNENIIIKKNEIIFEEFKKEEKYERIFLKYYELNKKVAYYQSIIYKKENKEKHKEMKKSYYERNKDKIRQQESERRKRNKEKHQQYYKECKEDGYLRVYNKLYREQNKDKIKEINKRYILKKKEKQDANKEN